MRLAIAVLIVASCSVAQSQKLPEPVNPQNTKKKQADPNKNDSNKNPLPLQEPIKADPKQERTKTADDDAENNRRIADYTDKLAQYTEALVAVGVIQAFIFIGHFVIFSKTLKAAREATAEQSRLTRKSNSITRRAVRESERSNAANETLTLESNAAAKMSTDAARSSADMLINSERAWLQIEIVASGNSALGIAFHLTNHGRTPGFVMKLDYGYRMFNTPLEEWPAMALHSQQWESGDMIPSSKASRDYTARIDATGLITESQVSAAREGKLFLVFVAKVWYRDIFWEKRETWCCQNFIPGSGWFFHGNDRMNGRT
jgi:hypothetical protein